MKPKKFKVKKLDSETIDLMFNQLADEMEKTCRACNADRITASFEPVCKDRWWLDVLIGSGVPKSELPQFCYQRRKEEIERFLKRKTTLVNIEDSRIFLKDFLDLTGRTGKVPPKDLEEYLHELKPTINFLRKHWKSVQAIEQDSMVFIFLNTFEVIIKINFATRIVTVNLENESITDDALLKFLLKKGSEMLNLPFDIFQTPIALYFQVKLEAPPTEKINTLMESVQSIDVPFHRFVDSSSLLTIGVTSNPKHPDISFGVLKSLFGALSTHLSGRKA